MISDVEHLVLYLLAICMSLGKCLFSSSAHLNGIFVVAVIEFYEFGYESLLRYIVCKYFLPFLKLPFHFIDCLAGILLLIFLCFGLDFSLSLFFFFFCPNPQDLTGA